MKPLARIGGTPAAALLGIGLVIMMMLPDRDAEAATESEARAVVLSLDERPSHHGRYRPRMLAAPEDVAVGRMQQWMFELRTAHGQRVEDAVLRIGSWMPEGGVQARVQPRAYRDLGDGFYLVFGIRFDRPGWWNLKVDISEEEGDRQPGLQTHFLTLRRPVTPPWDRAPGFAGEIK
jgi:hypothetical protein